ncbi:hypothetical protein GCM10020254_43860 [Streptomyces goshikiensis]
MGPLEAHEAYQLVSQVSQAMAAAHREGLSHLRLTPSAILRTSTGQYRIRGLAVNAALRGITSETPQRADTEAIGALLYAALTQRWPYESDAYGLTGLPKGVGLIAPDQVRAGVHRGLGELAMRALANDGATASRQEPACTTPEELAKAVAAMPRIRPPEPVFTAPPEYQHTTYQQGSFGRPTPPGGPVAQTLAVAPPPPPPAAEPHRQGPQVGCRGPAHRRPRPGQLAARRHAPGTQQPEQRQPAPADHHRRRGTGEEGARADRHQAGRGVLPRRHAPGPRRRPPHTYDGDSSTFWRTRTFYDGPEVKVKEGLGIVYDLGAEQDVSAAEIALKYAGNHTTVTLYATKNMSSQTPVSSMKKIVGATSSNSALKLTAETPVKTRYVLLWITAMPQAGADDYTKPGYKQAITDVKFAG